MNSLIFVKKIETLITGVFVNLIRNLLFLKLIAGLKNILKTAFFKSAFSIENCY